MSPAKRDPEATQALRASLVDHALRVVDRDGAAGLTMRALAAEAGCSVGLTYKVFTDRQELLVEICLREFERLGHRSDDLVERAGSGSVGANLTWYAEQLLASPAVALTPEIFRDGELSKAIAARVHDSGVGPGGFEETVTRYLAAEQAAGRVDPSVDVTAFGFVVAGAVHNLVVSGDAWPRPGRRQLARHLTAIADAIAPRP